MLGNDNDNQFTRGIAFNSGVCKGFVTGSGINCAFCTVLNFMDSWYVAHEIGHTLDANHDKYDNNCERGIMGGSADGPFFWSNCPNNDISQLLIHPSYGMCLYNEPDPSKLIWDFRNDISNPGDKYDADRQCAQYFGQKYKKGKQEDLSWLPPVLANPCEDLWCSYDLVLVSARCALEGTNCTDQNNRPGRCKVGKCVF